MHPILNRHISKIVSLINNADIYSNILDRDETAHERVSRVIAVCCIISALSHIGANLNN